jgi:Rrf2 family protein
MAGPIRVSDAASLALHAAAYLAAREGERVPTAVVAEALGVSSAHLAKVLRRLERAGILRARRGPAGGFALARDGGRVTLRDVYEAVEGPIRTERCLLGEPVCGGRCMLGGLMKAVDREVRRGLGGVRLGDVAARFRGRDRGRTRPGGRGGAGKGG